jgi:hypothetical protein
MNTLGSKLADVSTLEFTPGKFFDPADAGKLVPAHCGKTLTFHFPVSFCAVCGEEFDTVEIIHAARKAMGQAPVTTEHATLAGIICGVELGRI